MHFPTFFIYLPTIPENYQYIYPPFQNRPIPHSVVPQHPIAPSPNSPKLLCFPPRILNILPLPLPFLLHSSQAHLLRAPHLNILLAAKHLPQLVSHATPETRLAHRRLRRSGERGDACGRCILEVDERGVGRGRSVKVRRGGEEYAVEW
jgi:hypothetical protein